MRTKKSLAEFSQATGLPEKVLELSITEEENDLKKDDDYLYAGSKMYIYLPAALYLIGRFSLQDKHLELQPIIKELSQESKKTYRSRSNSALPGLVGYEKTWHDETIARARSNSAITGLSYPAFLSLIYKKMDVNLDKYKGEYLDQCGVKNCKITDFRIISVVPELRILFDNTMAKLMNENNANKLSRRYSSYA